MNRLKTLKVLVGFVLITSGIFGCQKEIMNKGTAGTSGQEPVLPEAISIKASNNAVINTPGGSVKLDVKVIPDSADQKYSLSISSGSDFATLSNNVLTAKKNGITVLKAETANGEHWDTCAVVISNQPVASPPSPTSITVKTPGRTGISTPGGSVAIEVTVTPSDADQHYTLSIFSGSEYATLANNILTARKNGTTILKAITTNGAHWDTCAVIITNQETIPSNALVIEDTVINSTFTGNSDIMVIQPRSYVPLIFRNNRITAQNSNEHIVMFGGESTGFYDHNLDGAVITGNKIVWTGTGLTDSNEGMLLGYSVNMIVKYNYIENCPYGNPTKSDGFTYTSGGVAYNIYGPSFKVGTGAKGVNGVKFYNNTFYNTRNTGEGVVGSIYINSNNDISAAPASKNCEIYNNIFYTKHRVPNIYCDNPSLSGLKCDYNVYYCEDGEPVFKIAGQTITLTQWRAMGYDKHSVVINPNFNDFTSLIPKSALNYGTNLGTDWQAGLDPSTQWNGNDPVLKSQGSVWQVGAYIK